MLRVFLGIFVIVFSICSLSSIRYSRNSQHFDSFSHTVVHHNEINNDPDSIVYLPLSDDSSMIQGDQSKNDKSLRISGQPSGLSFLSMLGLSFGSKLEENSNEQTAERTTMDVVFEADNYTLISTEAPEIVMTRLNGNKECPLDVSNILPSDFMPRRPLTMDKYEDESKYLQDYQTIDQDISRSESSLSTSADYISMRSDVLEDTDILYPSDHLSAQYTRLIYLNISDRERMVISSLYKRINETSCFAPIVDKFLRLRTDLNIDKSELWNNTKQSLLQEMELNGQLADVNDKTIEETIRNDFYQKRKERLKRYFSVDYHSSNDDYCDGCPIPTGIKKFRPIGEYPNHFLIRKWIGNEETNQIITNNNPIYVHENEKPYVSAIAAATYNRLFSIQQLLYRWRGNITIVLQCPKQEESYVTQFVNTHFFPIRFTFLLFLTDDDHIYSNIFPVNYLRNLAIRNIYTTHYLIIDMDLRPSTNTYDEIMKLPSYLFQYQKTAVILPVFFYNHTLILNNCNSIDDCAALTNEYQPENKAELIACIYDHNCMSNKRLVRTHMYVMPEWFITRDTSSVSRIRCFLTNFMEPYMMVRYSQNTPLFHEEFVDYGYNKVQYFEHLRQMGYQFYILNHAFAMDFPHMDSDFRVKYHNVIHSDTINPMKEVYNKLQKRFNSEFRHVKSAKVCFLKQKSYYQEL